MYKKVLASILSVMIIVGTTSTAFADNYYTTNNYYTPTHKEHTTGQKVKRALKYGAFGAGAGYVLSGRKHRGTNMIKGAAIGTAASILTGRR